MASDQHTKYTVYAGRAAEDLPAKSTELRVIVPELTPAALSGAFAPGTTPTQVQLKDLSGGAITAQPTTANHVVAVWEGTSNHAYPPYVKAGEQVDVVQYGDSDRYYWREKGRDRELRQLDRIRIEVSATPEKNAEKSDANTYFIELDAVAGMVQIKTSKANQEPFAYGIRLDTKNGILVISDDIAGTPNRIYLESGKDGGVPKLQLNNSQNATISLVGPDIIIDAPRDILQRAGRQVVQQAPVATLNWDIGVINGRTLGINSSESAVVQAPTFDVIGATKITGLLAAAHIRSGGFTTQAIGAAPTAPTTTPTAGTGTVGGNTADGSIPSDQRHATGQEQITTMMAKITTWFQNVRWNSAPLVDDSLNTLATQSKMSNLQDV